MGHEFFFQADSKSTAFALILSVIPEPFLAACRFFRTSAIVAFAKIEAGIALLKQLTRVSARNVSRTCFFIYGVPSIFETLVEDSVPGTNGELNLGSPRRLSSSTLLTAEQY